MILQAVVLERPESISDETFNMIVSTGTMRIATARGWQTGQLKEHWTHREYPMLFGCGLGLESLDDVTITLSIFDDSTLEKRALRQAEPHLFVHLRIAADWSQIVIARRVDLTPFAVLNQAARKLLDSPLSGGQAA